MLEEIAEQPAALERTIAEERAKIAKLGNMLKARDIDLIVLVARGSSDNAALFGRYLLEITTGIPVSLSAPSVHTIYGAEAASWTTRSSSASRSQAKAKTSIAFSKARDVSGAYTVGITNEPGLVDDSDSSMKHCSRTADANVLSPRQKLSPADAPLLYARRRAGPERAPFSYEAIPEFVAGALEQKPAIVELVAALRVHGKLCRRRSRPGLRKCVRAGIEVDGDLLRSRGAFLVGRFSAWSTGDGRAAFSGDTLRAARSDAAGR